MRRSSACSFWLLVLLAACERDCTLSLALPDASWPDASLPDLDARAPDMGDGSVADPDARQRECEDDDRDGFMAVRCGGDDCDDARASINPGAREVCDEADVDEDCDATTRGDDADGDGFAASACCRLGACGDDCDDRDRDVGPHAVELCDAEGRDEDCDGASNEPDCTALDECASPLFHDCDPVALCTDLEDGYRCSCPEGYDDVLGDGRTCSEPYRFARAIGGYVNGIALDGEGGAFLAGNYARRLDLGAGEPIVSGNDYRAFAAHLDAEGRVLWQQTESDATIDQLSAAREGSLLAVGGYAQAGDRLFGVTLTAAPGARGHFVAALDPATGELLWLHHALAPAATFSSQIAVDGEGRVYWFLQLSQPTHIAETQAELPQGTLAMVFDAKGALLGSSHHTAAESYLYSRAFVDAEGAVWLDTPNVARSDMPAQRRTLRFAPDGSVDGMRELPASTSIFFTKDGGYITVGGAGLLNAFDADGGALWTYAVLSVASGSLVSVNALAIDESGAMYALVSVWNLNAPSTDFGFGAQPGDAALLRFDAAGTLLASDTWTMGPNEGWRALAVRDGSVWLAGSYEDGAPNFSLDPIHVLPVAVGPVGFVAHLHYD